MKEFRSNKYYETSLKKQIENLEKMESLSYSKESDSLEVKNLNKIKTNLSLGMANLKIFSTMYSLGRPKEELISQHKKTFNLIVKNWDKRIVKLYVGREQKETNKYLINYHIAMRWLLSLSVLFGSDKEDFEMLKELIKRDKVSDILYDFLISSKFDTHKISKEMSIESPKNEIKDIILEADKNKCESMVKKYLDKNWYNTYKNHRGWYNSHLLPEGKLSFYGYWAFEVAALVKVKELNDKNFAQNKYYPNAITNCAS